MSTVCVSCIFADTQKIILRCTRLRCLCVGIVSFSFARLRGMDSSIDESDFGSLSRRRTSLEVEREGNRQVSQPSSLCLSSSRRFSRPSCPAPLTDSVAGI